MTANERPEPMSHNAPIGDMGAVWMSHNERPEGVLTEAERDQLRDWWDEDETASVESAFPIISRILAARTADLTRELARAHATTSHEHELRLAAEQRADAAYAEGFADSERSCDQKQRADGLAAEIEALVDELTWKRPERCPCDNPEACCGSEESCDAMHPHTRVTGATRIRALLSADHTQALAERDARVLREAADEIDSGPTFPLPPSVISTLLRERADRLTGRDTNGGA